MFLKKMHMMKYVAQTLLRKRIKQCPSLWFIKEIMEIIEPEYAKTKKPGAQTLISQG